MAKPKTPSTSSSSAAKGGRLGGFILAFVILLIAIGLSAAGTWFVLMRFYLPQQITQQVAEQVSQQVAQYVAAQDHADAAAIVAANAVRLAPPAASAMPEAPPAPIFVPLNAFTVTLANDQMERILHTAITLRVADANSGEQIKTYMPEVRSRINFILTQQQPDTVSLPETRIALAQAIAQAVSVPFAPQLVPQQIADVLFTEFVVQ